MHTLFAHSVCSCEPVLAMLIGTTIFGYVVGGSASLVAQQPSGRIRGRATPTEIFNYLREQHVPEKQRKVIAEHVRLHNTAENSADEHSVLALVRLPIRCALCPLAALLTGRDHSLARR